DAENGPRVTVTINKQPNLTEQIAYYRPFSKLPLLNRVLGQLHYVRLYRQLIREYIQQEGMPDFVHVQVPLKAGLLALWMKRKFGTRYILTEHYGIYNTVVRDAFEKRHFLYRLYTRKIIREAYKFQTASADIGNAINRSVVRKDFTVIYNVVNTSF